MVHIKKKNHKTKTLHKEIGAIGYSHFTDQEPEAQRSEATCPRPPGTGIWELGLHQAAWRSPALSPHTAHATQRENASHQKFIFLVTMV